MNIPAPIKNIADAKEPQVVTPLELVERRAQLKADAEYIADEIAKVDAQLIELLDTVGTHNVDGIKVQVREYTRTDYKKLADQYPAEQYPALYKVETVLDQDAVKNQFAPAALEEFVVHGKKSVVIP